MGWVAAMSRSRHSLAAMLLVAVIDASVFPVPPFALLIPMCIAQPKKAPFYAVLGAGASVFGGLLGYALGQGARIGVLSAFDFDPNVRIERFGLNTTLGEALGSEFWILALLASVLPTPYKVVAIGSGLVDVPLPRFILASVLGRSARFFGVALFTAYAREWYAAWRAKRAR